MKAENRVSSWLGIASSSSALEDYVQLGYSEDGDTTASQLMIDFGIEAYDEDFREAAVLSSARSEIGEILKGFSYDTEVIAAFESSLGRTLDSKINAVVLLYNFDANLEIGKEAKSAGVTLKFLGAVSYETTDEVGRW